MKPIVPQLAGRAGASETHLAFIGTHSDMVGLFALYRERASKRHTHRLCAALPKATVQSLFAASLQL